MIDVVFDLEGSAVPEYYPYLLWEELVRCLPWLKNDESAGVHPLRGSVSGQAFLLAKRSKLILRVAAEDEARVAPLSGQKLKVGGNELAVGKSKTRPLQAANTLHAWMVESDLGEVEFMAEVKKQLQSAGVSCNLICDKHRVISDGKRTLQGFGLVLHDLKPQASIQVQQSGLGGARHLGCGIFVPFKAITGLE